MMNVGCKGMKEASRDGGGCWLMTPRVYLVVSWLLDRGGMNNKEVCYCSTTSDAAASLACTDIGEGERPPL